jgi:hypothetical protein
VRIPSARPIATETDTLVVLALAANYEQRGCWAFAEDAASARLLRISAVQPFRQQDRRAAFK